MHEAEPSQVEVIDCEDGLRAALQKGIDDIKAGRFTIIRDEDELRAFFAEL